MSLETWLAGLGLERFLPVFHDAEVTEDVIADLTEADLEKLGIPLGPRKKLLKAIAGLSAATEFADAPAATIVPAPARAREAERRQLTVMFVDLVGSTALSASLDPEEMREVLKAYQNAVVGEISRVDGFTAKLMGDGVLAYFGWPRAHEDEPERAVRAGLAIVRAVAGLPASTSLACRVGIATGLVVVGDLVGEGAAQEEAVVGDTPNLAARLQALAAPGEVVVAEATRRLLGSGFAIESLGAHAVKGLAEPVPAFRVKGERAVESRFAGRAGETIAPMEGRDEELALLTRQWREAVAGEGRAILVVGEAGIGKSRLIRALREAVQPDRPTVLLYQCSPFHADSPFWPVIQQLTFAAGLEPSDDAEAKRQKLGRIVSTCDRLDLLASLLGIAADPDPLAGLDPQERRRLTLQALVDELTRLVAQGPVLVLMEDVHWVDPSTIELLRRTLEAITSRPVLVVLTSRPEAEPRLGTFPHLSRLVLSRLGRAAVEAIVGRLLEARAMDAGVRAQILARTDGVPLFVEELTKAMLEQAPAGLGVTVPSTLQDSLLARLDRDPLMKSVAQISSCIGREVDHALLVAVADLPPAKLAGGLDALVAAELVYRRGNPPEASYSFKHALVRDAAYESLLKTRRRELHGRVVELLEARGNAAADLVAFHAEAAGQTDKAVGYLLAAGREAASRSANLEAINHLRSGLQLLTGLPSSPQRARTELELSLALGTCLIPVKGFSDVETAAAYRRAHELASLPENADRLINTLFGVFLVELVGARLTDAFRLAREIEKIAASTGVVEHQLVAHRAVYGISLWQARNRECREHCQRIAELYDPHVHASLAVRYASDFLLHSTTHLARCLLYQGHPDQAASLLESALSSATRAGHVGTLGQIHWQSMNYAAELGDKRFGRLSVSRYHSFMREHAHQSWKTASDMVEIWSTRAPEAASCEAFRVAMVAFERAGSLGLPKFMTTLANMLIHAGDPLAAVVVAEEGLSRIARTSEHRWEPEIWCVRGAAVAACGNRDTDEQEHCYRRAIDIAREQGARLLELRASTSLARLWANQGDRQLALDLLAPIYGWFTEGFDAPDLVEAKTMLDALT